MGWLSFEKFKRLQTIVKWNGGLKQCWLKLFYHDELKIGCLVGTDQYGNKYYENNNYFFGRNRWVEYSPAFGFDYDASMIPPEWFGWMHYRTDYRPCEDPTRPFYPWQKPHVMNLTGTPDQYVPYDTTRPKIEAWIPPQAQPGQNGCKSQKETKIQASECIPVAKTCPDTTIKPQT